MIGVSLSLKIRRPSRPKCYLGQRERFAFAAVTLRDRALPARRIPMSAISLGASQAVGTVTSSPRTVPATRCRPLRPRAHEPFRPQDDATSPYRVPKTVRRAACAVLSPFRCRDAAFRLLGFLARFWTHPNRIERAFPVDRRALAGHRLLGLTEGEVRSALGSLEKAGIVTREPLDRRHAYRPTAEGLKRAPILWRFAQPFLAMFRSINRWQALRAKRIERAKAVATQPKENNSYILTPSVILMGQEERVSERVAVTDPSSELESALMRLGRAILSR